MSTTPPLRPPPSTPRAPRRGRWIDQWEPENETFWASTGRAIARKNLILSIFAENLGFSVWVLWTIVVLNLRNVGIAMKRLAAGLDHSAQFWVLLACAATAGFGGGNFSSSMANVSFFYPEGKKGLALGLNAAGGNLGTPRVCRPHVDPARRGGGDRRLAVHGQPDAGQAEPRAYAKALGHGHAWIMSLLYIGTFGSFIGYSFALPLVIKNTFPEFLAGNPFIATYLAGLGFVGALIGSVSRPLGGWMSDRLGGIVLGVATWVFYLRRAPATSRVPSLAHASI